MGKVIALSVWFVFIASCVSHPLVKNADFKREIAVTFDDLPCPQYNNVKQLRLIDAAIIKAIILYNIPAVGFVNEKTLYDDQAVSERIAVLKLWTDAGVELANHTFGHVSLNQVSLEEFKADVIKGEKVSSQLMKEQNKSLRYFRFPYLHTGDSLNKKQEAEAFLKQRGYISAPVTIDSDDWRFNVPYLQAKAEKNTEKAKALGERYLDFVQKKFAFYENATQRMFDRPIRHVLLLHANQLNADYAEQIFAMMKDRGYKFVTLEHALKDPAYNSIDNYVDNFGVAWLYRWDSSGNRVVNWSEDPEPVL